MKEQFAMPRVDKSAAREKEQSSFDKGKIISELERMLYDVFSSEYDLTKKSKNAVRMKEGSDRAQGFVDGYMRALTASGVCSNEELLELVKKQRELAKNESRSS